MPSKVEVTSLRERRKPTRPSEAFAYPGDASTISTPSDTRARVDGWVAKMDSATPMQRIEAERSGVPAVLLRDLAVRMNIPSRQICTMLGVSEASVARKAKSGAMIGGSAGQAALGLGKLLATARTIVADSTAAEAKDFDYAIWLGRWVNCPQAALGQLKPAEIIATPTGVAVVARLLGALESGAYQ